MRWKCPRCESICHLDELCPCGRCVEDYAKQINDILIEEEIHHISSDEDQTEK
jgi:hypothetical protein